MRHSLWFFITPILLFFQVTLFSQEPVTVSGTIADKTNNLPLQYAQISLAGSATGTCSNEDGKFTLILPGKNENDTLLFSYLGYEMVKIPVKSLIGMDSIIKMQPKIFQLSEVEIISLTPEEVIRRAVANIPENYGADSVVLTAFIRNQKVINNRLAEYTEAILEDLKTGYLKYDRKQYNNKLKSSNIALLVKGRVISDTNLVNAMGDAGKSAGCLGCMFMNDFVEYPFFTILDDQVFKYYEFRMEELVNPGGRKIYHIFYNQKQNVNRTLWKGEIYIESVSYAIMKLTQKPSMEAFNTYEKKKYRNTYELRNKPGWIAEMPHIHLTMTYCPRNGKWTLGTMQNEYWILFTFPATGEKITINSKSEVVVTDVTYDPEKLAGFRGVEKKGNLQRWDQVIGDSDESFWATFNYLPVEMKLKESLEYLGRQ